MQVRLECGKLPTDVLYFEGSLGDQKALKVIRRQFKVIRRLFKVIRRHFKVIRR